MDSSKLASGDAFALSPSILENYKVDQKETGFKICRDINEEGESVEEIPEKDNEITPQMIESNESKLKSRIAQCKSIIDSLKCELTEEKARMEKESKMKHRQQKADLSTPKMTMNYGHGHVSAVDYGMDDYLYSSMYSASVDSKLNCDENLIEYEKQLQKYQNTLHMAQNEKKNAIRKQMLTKAYRLKLLEVENQCNIELLRVKQSLQCLEPLQMIASKWKTNTDDIYDINNFELIPRYPELNANSGSDINSYKEEFDKNEKPEVGNKDDTTSCD